ncbi:hypothetical protein JTB14_011142 [Gonioctena quinquepunctata]|nr:hypothetical protein JTB14_011142 [Gonioctena quinquepunctata]
MLSVCVGFLYMEKSNSWLDKVIKTSENGNKLFVNGKAYEADDLANFPLDKPLEKPTSAPATPTTYIIKKPSTASERPLEKPLSTPKSSVDEMPVPKQKKLNRPRTRSIK